jgi:hypothetical protein
MDPSFHWVDGWMFSSFGRLRVWEFTIHFGHQR